MAQKVKTSVKAKEETKVKVDTKTKTRSSEVRAAIKETVEFIDSRFMALAEMLSEAYHREYHKGWGYEDGVGGWKRYCVEELEMHHRKAYYYIEIWDKVKSLDLNPKEFEKLGWSKVKEIVSVMTTKNAKEWLEKAKKMSVRELTEAVKIIRRKKAGKGKDDVPEVTTIKFTGDSSQMNIVTDALEEAKGLLDSEDGVAALVMICQDWLETKGVNPQVATLDDHVKFLEKQFGVGITYKKVSRAAEKEEKADKPVPPKAKTEKDKIVEKAKKKAGKEGKKAAAAAADDMEDILSDGDGPAETDEDLDKALGLDD